MSHPQRGAHPHEAVNVVHSTATMRLLLVLLAGWSFFAGFSLFTHAIDALSFGGDDRAAERTIGLLLMFLAVVYAMLAWRREQYRLFMWLPFAAQLAIIVPIGWEMLTSGTFDEAVLLLVVSVIFLALMSWVWWDSREMFLGDDPGEEEDEGEEEYDEDEEPYDPREESARHRRYRRS
jgi:cbb3-type cytochrome oxidase subunit 3